MRKLRYQLVDVFTNERFGGNPLAVFTNGRGVDAALMQQIARELQLSETVFVLPPDNPANDWRLRIFTPATEMPMAGHPTVGAAFVLAREHLVELSAERSTIRLEEGVGPINVTFDFDEHGGLFIHMEQPLPRFGPVFPDRALIADILSLSSGDLLDLPIEVASSGVPFLYVPLRSLEAAGRVKLRMDLWETALKDFAASQIFVFTPETVLVSSTVHGRMFAPALGLAEDAATGAASGPLGCYLVRHGLVGDSPALIVSEQGFEMGRRSLLYIRVEHEGDQFRFVSVGGQCVAVGEGVIEV